MKGMAISVVEFQAWGYAIVILVDIIYKIKYQTDYRSCDLLKKLGALIGGKFVFKKNPLQDFLSSLNAVISTKVI